MSRASRAIVFGAAAVAAGCLDDVEVPPDPPVLFPVPETTHGRLLQLAGTKPAGTAVLDHGEVLVPHDGETSWRVTVELAVGENLFDLTTQLASGLESVEHTRARVFYDRRFPEQPTLEPVRSPTNRTEVPVRGTKPVAAALELRRVDDDGGVLERRDVAPLGDSTEWSYTLHLGPDDGAYLFELVARDARGRTSEPLDFSLELDRTPPHIAARYPAPGMSGVPIDAEVEVAFDGALAISGFVDPNLLTVVRSGDGAAVAGEVSYRQGAHAIVFEGEFAPGTDYTVRIDPQRLADAAGNPAVPGDEWSWSFSTGSAAGAGRPEAPTASVVGLDEDGRTRADSVVVAGSKPAWTSIWFGGQEVVPVSAETQWRATWYLVVGPNALDVVARAPWGASSAAVHLEVERVAVRPDPPEVDPVPASVDQPVVTITGTKPAQTSLLANGQVVVPRGPETEWAFDAELVPGTNDIELRTRDREGALSDPVRVQVRYEQPFSGPVPPDFALAISFSLRDLSAVQPVASSFDTGANHYAVDIWLEGPLGSDERCLYDERRKERRGIEYAATVVHYVGTKPGRQNPFWLTDYRSPDYLAALISGGVFEPAGIARTADRRDDRSGARGGEIVDSQGRLRVSADDLRNLVDGVTEATSRAGPKVVTWRPVGRDGQPLPQGEYLVHVAINLDRDPTWVLANDVETCWGDARFDSAGAHRIVQRLPLGAEPFVVRAGQDAERSGPDAEAGGAGLRYIGSEGITFRWGPAQ